MKLKQLLISTTTVAAIAVVPISIVSCGNTSNSAVEELPSKPGGDNNTQQPGGDNNTQQPGGDNNTQQPGGDNNTQQPGGDNNTQQPGGDNNTQQPTTWWRNNFKTNAIESRNFWLWSF